MKEERLQILRMVQEGIINGEEAAKLLAALGGSDSSEKRTPTKESPFTSRPRWLRIRVTDKNREQTRVNLTIPLSLLDWGLKLAESTGIDSLNIVRDLIYGGAEGKILEIDDSSSSDQVEIFVE